jgi:hypothetical protein
LAQTEIAKLGILSDEMRNRKPVKIISHPHPVWQDRATTFVYAVASPLGTQGFLEQLPARWLSDTRAEICAIPFDCYGISLGDTVSIEYVGNVPIIHNILEVSEYRTFRVAHQRLSEEKEDMFLFFRSRSCLLEHGCEVQVLSVAVPLKYSQEVEHYLTHLEHKVGYELFESADALPLQTYEEFKEMLWMPNTIYAHPYPAWREHINGSIWLRLDDGDSTLFDYEQIWVHRFGDSLAQVCCIPFVVTELCLGDIVLESEGEVRLVKKSGNKTLWVWTEADVSEVMVESVQRLFHAGYEYEWVNSRGLVVSAPSLERAHQAETLLRGAGWENVVVGM